ncbi:hypothetical protein A0J61_10825 [Choanephora cucurbitarum]|uniref:Uncharacterized protein n=1 Tax=Choanephora cucurbitarum TaxID=101091 RepID=A0A1C7MXF5_9FUNG|nr:hypothetical protein A0J61_10825 [Choanephora cucurbitarum]
MTAIKKVVEGVTGEWDLYIYPNYNEETGETTELTKEQVTQRMRNLQEIVFPAIEAKTLIAIKA